MTPPREVLRFAIVGAIGFTVDGGLLWVLISNGIDPFLARVFSFPIAVIATWLLNRIWTFAKAAKTSPGRQLNRYFILQVIGALTNFAVYSAILSFIEPTPVNALAALAVGAVAGMVVNYLGSRHFVFSTPMDNETEPNDPA